jgi:hypothetical protein
MYISRPSAFAVLFSTCIFAASPTVAGQGRGGGGPKPHPVKQSGSTTHMTAPKASPAPKVHGGGSAASQAPKSTTTTAAAKGPKTSKAPASVTANGKTKSTTTKTPASTTASTKSKSTTTTTASATTTSATGTTVPLTKVQEKLQKSPNLASKLESRLPPGTDLMRAAEDFRNLGQFVAAVNVSNNLNIPFADLKMSMVDDGLSLGQSIQKLRPTANATQEASLAESQATVILNTTTTTTAATTTKTPKTTTAVKKPLMKTSGGAR